MTCNCHSLPRGYQYVSEEILVHRWPKVYYLLLVIDRYVLCVLKTIDGHAYEQQPSSQAQHLVGNGYESARRGDRYGGGGACRNGTVGGSDSENSTVTVTYRRRPKQYNSHASNRDKNSHAPVVNNHTLVGLVVSF